MNSSLLSGILNGCNGVDSSQSIALARRTFTRLIAPCITPGGCRCPGHTGMTSRNGSERTLAAMHHQLNQMVDTPLSAAYPFKRYTKVDVKRINRLSVLGVRKNPFIEVTPSPREPVTQHSDCKSHPPLRLDALP
jgi:hypothetical protein